MRFNSYKNKNIFIGAGQFTVANINSSLCTHYLYAFANLDGNTYDLKVSDPWGDITLGGYTNFVAIKSKNPNVKVMISLGGWTDSTDGTGKYSKLVASSTNIATFVNYSMAFLSKYKFDGLDLDWECPSTSADKTGFANLLVALRNAFNTKGYILSAAVPANPTLIDKGTAHNQTIVYLFIASI
jgi:chitinase